MAKRVSVTLVDDTDGTDADETVSFALDGVSYEIDLSSSNADQLRNGLATWIGFATRSGGRKATKAVPSKSGGRRDVSAVREWARANGYAVSERGRIAADVQAAYDKAGA